MSNFQKINKLKLIVVIISTIILISSTVIASDYEFAIEPKFSSCCQFQGGIAKIYLDNKVAVIDKEGNYVIEPCNGLNIRANGLIELYGENEKTAFFDKNGNQVTDYIYDAYITTNGKGSMQTKNYYFDSSRDGDGKSNLIPVSRDHKYGFINENGEEVIEPKFEYAEGFFDSMARIGAEGILSSYGTYTQGKYGFANENGEVIVSPKYWVAQEFNNGYGSLQNGDIAKMVDTSGNIHDLGNFSYISNNGKYILAGENGNLGVLDMAGNIIIPFLYDHITLFGDYFIISHAFILNNKNEKILEMGEGISPPDYYMQKNESNFIRFSVKAPDFEENGHAFVGLINKNANVIAEPVYDRISDLGEGVIYAQKGGNNFLLDYNANEICRLNGNCVGQYFSEGLLPVLDFDTMKIGYIKNPLLKTDEKNEILVLIDNNKVDFDVKPIIENGCTLVPLRAIFEALCSEVSWDEKTQTATATKDDTRISITIGNNILLKNGEEIRLDIPAKIVDDRTLVPIRAISESFGYKVDWDDKNKTVIIKIN